MPKGAAVVDAGRGLIAPGFVDIHVHGGDGADFMDGTAAAVRTAIRCHTRHGTTTIFPTTTTGSRAQIEAMLDACGSVERGWSLEDGARIGGVQEGIFRRHMRNADGSWRDTVYFSILDREWPGVKKRLEERLAR